MNQNQVIQFLIFLVGLMSGILLECRVFNAYRLAATSAPTVATLPVVAISNPADSTPKSDTQVQTDLPIIEISKPVFDFGTAERGDLLEHEFVITNAGKAPLLIEKAQPTCGCTTVQSPSKAIEPGQQAGLKAVFDTRGRLGSQNSTIIVKSNDPHATSVRLSIVGKVVSRIVAEPSTVDFGRILPGQPSNLRQVNVRSVDGLKFKIVRTEVSHSGLSLDVTETIAQESFDLAVSLKPETPDGLFKGWVKVHTDHPGNYREFVIPVNARSGTSGPIMVGDEVVIHGPTIGGGSADLKDLRGHVVVLVFWASWCGHCEKELPTLVQLYRDFGSRGAAILGVNVDTDSAKAEAAVSKLQLPWPNIHYSSDQEPGTPNPLIEKYQVKGIPAVYLIDRNGRVQSIGLRGPGLKARVEQLLNSKSVATNGPTQAEREDDVKSKQ